MPGPDAGRRISSRDGISRAGPGDGDGYETRIPCGGGGKSKFSPARSCCATTEAVEEQSVEARVAEREGLSFANG